MSSFSTVANGNLNSDATPQSKKCLLDTLDVHLPSPTFVIHPILNPRTNPAMNDALGWKSAVKKSINQFHRESTLGGLIAPEMSLV